MPKDAVGRMLRCHAGKHLWKGPAKAWHTSLILRSVQLMPTRAPHQLLHICGAELPAEDAELIDRAAELRRLRKVDLHPQAFGTDGRRLVVIGPPTPGAVALPSALPSR